MNEKWIKHVMAGAAVVLLAGSVHAQNVRYKSNGNWNDTTNTTANANGWQSLSLPDTNIQARINWGDNTVTVTNAVPAVKNLQIGVDESGRLEVNDGGYLTSSEWSSVGNNAGAVGRLTVNSGGEADFPSHLWVGFQSPAVGHITVNDGGIVRVGGLLSCGWGGGADETDGGTGYITVNKGGLLDLDQLHSDPTNLPSFKNGSWLNIVSTGQVKLPGDYTDVINLYTNDAIRGNGVAGNIALQYDVTGVGTNAVTNSTTIVAVAAVPDVVGTSLAAATTAITDLGYQLGDVFTNYVYGVPSGNVLSQDPVAGTSLGANEEIDVWVQEAFLPQPDADTIDWHTSGANPGDWYDAFGWRSNGVYNTGIVPYKETQNFKVRTWTDRELMLTNFAAVSWLVQGDGGTTNGNVLTVGDGGHLVAGGNSTGSATWTAIGYSVASTVNVLAGGIYETKSRVLFAWGAGPVASTNYTCTINVDGGSFICNGWMSLGNKAKEVFGEVNVSNGGSFEIERINYSDTVTNGVINMAEGKLIMKGNRTGEIDDLITDGTIVLAAGMKYELDYDVSNTGKSTLTVYLPGYDAWAGLWGEDIGDEDHDHDNDGANNLWEYGLNGDPTDDQNTGVDPVFSTDGGVVTLTHLKHADDDNLVYTVQTRESLTIGTWLDTGATVIGTDITGGDYNAVTNSIDDVDAMFIRLKIDNP